MTNQKKYILISLGIVGVMAVFFVVGTMLHNPQGDFEKSQAGNVAKTGEEIVLSVIKAQAQEIAKTIDIFGEIDQDAIIINANMPSTISHKQNEGARLHKGQSVLHFINGINIPMPFDGTVSEIFVEEGQNVAIGEKLFIAVPTSSSKTKIKLDLPITNASMVSRGMDVSVIYNNENIAGKISNISVYSSKESGSVKVTVEMPKNTIPHNTVTQVMIEIAKYQGYFVPKTAVILSDGMPSVKIINAQNTVETVVVEVIKETDEGFYIASLLLSDTVKIIAVNPNYATDGKQYQFSVIE